MSPLLSSLYIMLPPIENESPIEMRTFTPINPVQHELDLATAATAAVIDLTVSSDEEEMSDSGVPVVDLTEEPQTPTLGFELGEASQSLDTDEELNNVVRDILSPYGRGVLPLTNLFHFLDNFVELYRAFHQSEPSQALVLHVEQLVCAPPGRVSQEIDETRCPMGLPGGGGPDDGDTPPAGGDRPQEEGPTLSALWN